MKRVFRTGLCLVGLLLLWVSQATSAEKVSYVVLPFTIQGPQGYAYLERSIPQMLTSRLYWKGRVESAVADLPASQKPVSDEAAAEKARAAYRADYVVWGTVTVVGDTCSLDVRVRNKAGKVWPQSRESKPNTLIAAIKSVSDTINFEVFGRKAEATAAAAKGEPTRVNQMNPDIMINENTPKDVYLNPQFRYSGAAGGDTSRLRSQTLPFASIGMEVVDADGDGKNEIFILADHVLYAYRFGADKLNPLGEFKFPMTNECLSLRSLSSRATGKAQLIVNMVDKTGTPLASILSFDGKSFKQEASNIRYYLNVVKLAPDYIPTLIGQQAQPPRLFQPGIYEMIKLADGYTKGRRLDLPDKADVFNFTYMPAGRGEKDGGKILVLDQDEHILTYTAKGARLAQSPEKYSGSAKGLEIDPTIPGLGQETVTMRSMYYIPMRMLAVDLDRDGNYELIVNRPISTASEIFDRYRFYPQSEIHALYWDGVGMNLLWKTRRIKGSMADYAIADANNDGIPDLVTCLNTHPGALGTSSRKTIIVLYPLDGTKVDPNTPAARDDE